MAPSTVPVYTVDRLIGGSDGGPQCPHRTGTTSAVTRTGAHEAARLQGQHLKLDALDKL